MRPYPRWMASALDGLTDAQRDAVTHRGSPLLVIGGPGTGKTEVLVRRLVWLADGGLAPHAVLVLSAQEGLRERIERALERPHEELAIHTRARVLRRAAQRRGAPRRHRPVRRRASARPTGWRCCSSARDELELAHHDFRGRPLALFASFVRRIDRLKAELIDAAASTRRGPPALDGRGRASASASSPACWPPTTACSTERGVFDEGGVLARCVGAAARRRGAARAGRRALPGAARRRLAGPLLRRARAGRRARGRRQRADRGRRRRPGGRPRARRRRRQPAALRRAAPRRLGGLAVAELPLPPARARRRARGRRRRRRRGSARTCAAAPAARSASGARPTSARRRSASRPSSSG